MKNLELAKIFYEIADILEIKNVEWKPGAYRKAAKSLESLPEDVETMYKKGKALENIPGIGKNLAKKIIEFIKTGKVKEHERLKKTIPKHFEELMKVPGLGARRAKLLFKKLKISSVKELEKAAKTHKIAKLKTFGEKSEENILKGLELFKGGKERILLGLVLPTAKDIENRLKKLKEVNQVSVAGSVRRKKETIRDIDILITASNSTPVMNLFTKMPEVKRILAKGPTKSSVLLKNNLQVDVRVVEKKCFGSALQYFTGNKEHNIKLREIAIKKNLKLSEYGLFDKRTNKRIAGKTEEEIYKKLGLPFIEPELRENTGEIEKKPPRLVELKDIKGDFHVHTKWSDGSNSIMEMANSAKKLNYKYICICDHSKGIRIARGLSENQLLKQIKEIKKINNKLKDFRILCGTEVNIKPDGTLDYSDDILKKLDVVTAAVHFRFKMSKEKMTERIIKAIKNEHVDIIDHPTGRVINRREPYELDLNKVFEAAKETNTFLEINSFPDRLDLKDAHSRSAIENGVKLAIGTDSHNINHLRYIELGVATARRGWAEKKDILNCLSLKQLSKIFKFK